VGEEIRGKVRKAAAELGYRPDYFAAAMAGRRLGGKTVGGAIACLVGHQNADPRGRYEHYELVFGGMRERCAEMGFSLDTFWVFDPGMSTSRLHQILQARGIEGCVLMSLSPNEMAFPWERYCLVQAAANTMHAEVDYSAIDYYNATHSALTRMRARLRDEIALVLPPDLNSALRERIVGAYHAFHASTGPRHTRNMVLSAVSARRQRKRLGAALCWGCEEAKLVLDSLMVPSGRVASLHLLHRDVGYPGMLIPYRELGAVAVDLLWKKMRERRYGITEECRGLVIEGKWEGTVAA
jgi:LacI family transcriptional regulator